jgi:hypothetical protein
MTENELLVFFREALQIELSFRPKTSPEYIYCICTVSVKTIYKIKMHIYLSEYHMAVTLFNDCLSYV